MQKGDDNQQKDTIKSEEMSEASATTLWFNDMPYTSIVSSSTNGSNYSDIIKVLSQVELPSPSPMLPTSSTLVREDNFISFDEGQPSGINKVDDIEEIKGHVEQERELKVKHENNEEHGTQRLAPETHSTRRRQVSRIHERIRALKALIPNCTKRDQASILDDVINYIKFLQMQLQMVQSMGIGHMSQGVDYMTLARQPRLPTLPNVAPNFTMTPFIGMQHGMPQFGSYFPVNYPIFPTSLPGFRPMQVGTRSIFPWAQPRPILYPQELQFPSQISQSVYSTTTPSSDTIIPTANYSQAGSATGHGQSPLYHAPVTSQGTE